MGGQIEKKNKASRPSWGGGGWDTTKEESEEAWIGRPSLSQSRTCRRQAGLTNRNVSHTTDNVTFKVLEFILPMTRSQPGLGSGKKSWWLNTSTSSSSIGPSVDQCSRVLSRSLALFSGSGSHKVQTQESRRHWHRRLLPQVLKKRLLSNRLWAD